MKTRSRFSRMIRLLIVVMFPSIALAQFSKPFNLSPDAVSALLNESMGSCIGTSNDTVHVIWSDRKNATHGAIYYTRSADTGIHWSIPVAITDISGNAWNPAIAVNGASVHVVWREIDTLSQKRSSHYKHSLDGGNTWSAAILLDTAIADWPAVTVSGNYIYVANDIVVSDAPYNTDIFFLRSADNGSTWNSHQQLTFANGRSEDEAINARGADVFMSWNDNRNGQMQIFYKHSGDHGLTWDSDLPLAGPQGYGTMICVDSSNIDVPFAGAPSGRYQTHLVQSGDNGVNWSGDRDLTSDTANTYYYPYMVRDGAQLHLTYIKSGVGGQYLHSGDGGSTWDRPVNIGSSVITPFIAYTGCVLHVIVPDSGHINYLRDPAGNTGPHCKVATVPVLPSSDIEVKLYPNPFFTETTFEIISSSEIKENYMLKIFDAAGREIANAAFGITNKINFYRNTLSNGIYFYKVYTKEKVITTGKIVAE
jgi:hypothetical protein